jgi:hypothetical protein
MLGHANNDHLEALIQERQTPHLSTTSPAPLHIYNLQHLRDESGNWSQRDDVYITYHSDNSLRITFNYIQQGQLIVVSAIGFRTTVNP